MKSLLYAVFAFLCRTKQRQHPAALVCDFRQHASIAESKRGTGMTQHNSAASNVKYMCQQCFINNTNAIFYANYNYLLSLLYGGRSHPLLRG